MTGAGTNSAKLAREGGPVIILVRPQLAVNIGMCARAMANFGLCDLRLVAPLGGWPRQDGYSADAYAAAAGAIKLLESARVFATLEEAVADLHFVYAATARERGQDKPVVLPRSAMADCAQAVSRAQKIGVLFGPERTGLDNDEVALASAILTFPVNPAYASLNLAQAVLLTGYEYFCAAYGAVAPYEAAKRPPPAPRRMTLAFFDYLENLLEEKGFFRPASKRPIMQRNLRNMFHRMDLSEQDVRTFWGMIVRLVEGPRKESARQRAKALREQALADAAKEPKVFAHKTAHGKFHAHKRGAQETNDHEAKHDD